MRLLHLGALRQSRNRTLTDTGGRRTCWLLPLPLVPCDAAKLSPSLSDLKTLHRRPRRVATLRDSPRRSCPRERDHERGSRVLVSKRSHPRDRSSPCDGHLRPPRGPSQSSRVDTARRLLHVSSMTPRPFHVGPEDVFRPFALGNGHPLVARDGSVFTGLR